MAGAHSWHSGETSPLTNSAPRRPPRPPKRLCQLACMLCAQLSCKLPRTPPPPIADACAAADARAAAAEHKVGRLEELAHTLQKEVAGKGGALARLEEQASGGWGAGAGRGRGAVCGRDTLLYWSGYESQSLYFSMWCASVLHCRWRQPGARRLARRQRQQLRCSRRVRRLPRSRRRWLPRLRPPRRRPRRQGRRRRGCGSGGCRRWRRCRGALRGCCR